MSRRAVEGSAPASSKRLRTAPQGTDKGVIFSLVIGDAIAKLQLYNLLRFAGPTEGIAAIAAPRVTATTTIEDDGNGLLGSLTRQAGALSAGYWAAASSFTRRDPSTTLPLTGE